MSLVERLRSRGTFAGGLGFFHNPDGPEAATQLEAMQAEVEGYQVALLWAESHDPWLVEKIREKAASLSKDKL